MKKLRFSAFTALMCLLLFACNNPRQSNLKRKNTTEQELSTEHLRTTININKPINVPKNAFRGDFDGNGAQEWAWLIPPKLNEDEMSCVGACDCTITFSDPNIPNLIISEYCIGGIPQNEKDLNDDGSDEISIIPHWFTSSWRSANVYHLTENGWQAFIRPIQIWLNGDSTLDYVQRDLENEDHVIITEYRWANEMTEVIIVSESIKVD